jgi:hypothetical protein
MRYIGTSLGRCLRSILLGEVSEDQVFLIVTGTRSHTEEEYLEIIKQYYYERYGEYDISQWTYEEVKELATRLWNNGKIHQPRNFDAYPFFPGFGPKPLWIEIFPPHLLQEPAAKDLWDKLTVIARLYE